MFFCAVAGIRATADSISSEKREGTIGLLLLTDLRGYDIVIGKFLGAWAYYSLLLILTVIYQLILVWLAPPDIGTVISAYIGLWLLGGAALAVGMLFSAITENQIVAGFLSLAALLILWLTGQAGTLVTNRDVAVLIRSFSFQAHYLYSFSLGVVRLDDIVFFVGMIGALLFVTTRLVESRRWR